MLKRRIILFMGVAGLSVGVYLLASALTYRLGFPLDDAWIHQTYALSLGQSGEWTYLPGQISGGSTSPLWTIALAIGYAVRVNYLLWAFVLGWVLLTGLAVSGMFAFGLLTTKNGRWKVLAGILLILEWHLVWAAVSGMETLFFAVIVLLVITLITADWKNKLVLGLLIGLSVWVRPDGITLFGPALLGVFLSDGSLKKKMRDVLVLSLGFTLAFGPYLWFNRSISGEIWPNTFFAKQAEYAIELQEPLFERLLDQALLPLIGVGVILLPGFVYLIRIAINNKHWHQLLGPTWALGYLGLYALRLPVTYQHGRYIIPMMPVFFVWGFAGLVSWIEPDAPRTWKRLVSRVWLVSTVAVLVAFWLVGARTYGGDVAIIESEMVQISKWVSKNLEPDALLAAHDIGALGYFGDHPILDLAGLISPEVIPFIRDEQKLADYLDEQGAEFLLTFPDWYPFLVSRAMPIYQTDSPFSPSAGGENMVVYRWDRDLRP